MRRPQHGDSMVHDSRPDIHPPCNLWVSIQARLLADTPAVDNTVDAAGRTGLAAVPALGTYLTAFAAWVAIVLGASSVLSGDPPPVRLWTHNDYAAAFQQARDEGKLLLVFFDDGSKSCRQFDARISGQALAGQIDSVVGVRLALDASMVSQGSKVRLLDQKGFRGLDHGPGLAIVDLKHRDASCYGWVVSVWKFGQEDSITIADLAALLALPPGNRQQREAAWAAHAARTAEGRASEAAAGAPPSDPAKPAAGTPEPESPAPPATAPAAPRQTDQQTPLPPAMEGHEAKSQKGVAQTPAADGPVWLADYGQAVAQAKRDGKMLLIHFVDENDPLSRRLETAALQDAEVNHMIGRYALLRLPHDATVTVGEQQISLLKHEAFSEMLGRPGLAIVDYAHRNSPHYETVVSQFPVTQTLSYSPSQVAVMLDLPPGTLTQRTLIYAVRTHPDRPASADGELLPELQREAESHSGYQARILRQGHHQWETRFHRLNAVLPRGLVAREVCAESWPGQNLLEAAIECVRCWRLSSGHWSAVRARQSAFGYDMKRGRNGVWYATGVFGGR